MKSLQIALLAMLLGGTSAVSASAQDAALDPNGTFVDQWGTTFTFSICGQGDLCGTLDVLKGDSATEENLAFVGKQVMQAQPDGPSKWKGALEAGGLSAAATVTQTGPDTIDIEGCRAAILCETISYTRQQRLFGTAKRSCGQEQRPSASQAFSMHMMRPLPASIASRTLKALASVATIQVSLS